LLTLIPTAIGVMVLYISGNAMGLSPRRGRGVFVTSRPLRHLAILAAMLFLIFAAGAWLEIPGLLTSSSGILHGASYTDVHARRPALRALTVASLFGAALAVYQAFWPGPPTRSAESGWEGRFWPIVLAVVLYVVVSIAGAGYASIVQRFY